MNPPVLAFFSSRIGSGTLTEMCLGPDSREQLWQPLPDAAAVRAAFSLSTDPNPSLKCPPMNLPGPNLQLLPGNPALQLIEDQLAEAWCSCLDGNETAFRTTLTPTASQSYAPGPHSCRWHAKPANQSSD